MNEGTDVLVARIGTVDATVDVTWDPALLAPMASGDELQRAWQLEGEPDWEKWESLRVLSAAFEDGSVLLFASLRPTAAAGHDDDIALALRGRGDSDPAPLLDPLISIQRGAGGDLERINLEASEDTGPAIVRAAGDAVSVEHDGAVERIVLRMRMAGSPGFGTLDVLGRA